MKKILNIIAIVLASFSTQAQTQYLQDDGFDAIVNGLPTPWYQNSSLNPLSIERINFGGHSNNTCLAFSLLVDSANNGGVLYQTFTLQTNKYNCKLEFFLKCITVSGSSNESFAIDVDTTLNGFFSNTKYRTTCLKSDSAMLGPLWTKISVNIDTMYAGKNYITIAFLGPFSGVLTGNSTFLIDDITLTSGYPTAIDAVCNENCNVKVYPTSIQDKLNIENLTEQNCTATIINLSGQVVQKSVLHNSGNQPLHINPIKPDMYILQITNSKGQIINTSKLIKQ